MEAGNIPYSLHLISGKSLMLNSLATFRSPASFHPGSHDFSDTTAIFPLSRNLFTGKRAHVAH